MTPFALRGRILYVDSSLVICCLFTYFPHYRLNSKKNVINPMALEIEKNKGTEASCICCATQNAFLGRTDLQFLTLYRRFKLKTLYTQHF